METVISYLHWVSRISPRRSNRLNDNFTESESQNKIILLSPESELKNQISNEQTVQDICDVAESGNLWKLTVLFQMHEIDKDDLVDKQGQPLLHYAVKSDSVAVIDFVLQHNPDLDITDKKKNTAIHIAVMSSCLNSIVHLIQRGAKCNELNSKCLAPIHLAVELNNTIVLKKLLSLKEINGHIRGQQGRTALHFACIYDYHECVSLLLDCHGCCPTIACYNGFYAIHEACRNASEKSLNLFFIFASNCKVSKHELMNFYDAEGNTPLHAAVHGGNVKAVELCLNNGACICKQQRDKSTPLHLACSRGSLPIVKVLLGNEDKSLVSTSLSLVDAQQMTPLHMAAMFNHPHLVSYLVSEGADVKLVDQNGCTPLLLAARHRSWDAMAVLTKLSDLEATDNEKRNIFHLIVLNGGSVESVRSILCSKSTAMTLLNEKDKDGCSPIHHATQLGKLTCIEALIHNGVDINCKNKEHQSPLHFAAKYGRFNTVRKLINSSKQTFLLNDTDRLGNTALHLAAENGQAKVIIFLLSKGAAIMRNHLQQTALHRAAMQGYTHSARHLLSVHGFLIDNQDIHGNTALHYAVQNNRANVVKLLLDLNCKLLKNNKEMNPVDFAIESKSVDAIVAMVSHSTRKREILNSEIKNYESVYHALIESKPCVMKVLLDSSIKRSSGVKIDAENYYIKYDFEFLEYKEKRNNAQPLPILNAMVKYKRENLLSHNLCKHYLVSKWMSYGMISTLLGLFIYFLFMIALTLFVLSTFNSKSRRDSIEKLRVPKFVDGIDMEVLKYFIWGGVIYSYCKEMAQLVHQKWNYLLDPVNYIEWCLFILTPMVLCHADSYQKGEEKQVFLVCSATAVFISWFISLLYLQRFNGVGLYIVMFLQILTTLVKVMLIFSIVILAFSLSFHILLGDTAILGLEKGFFHVPLAILRVLAMMLGELDFLGSFVKPFIKANESIEPQLILSMVFFVLFGILVPVLMMNLLIGLAVGDIETVRRNALLKTLAMQVEIHTDLEQRLPNKFIKRVCKQEMIVYPNLKKAPGFRIFGCVRILSSLMANSIFEERKDAFVYDQQNVTLNEDLERQRQRLKKMSQTINNQHELIRLIVQKMEIVNEQDDYDEGDSDVDISTNKVQLEMLE